VQPNRRHVLGAPSWVWLWSQCGSIRPPKVGYLEWGRRFVRGRTGLSVLLKAYNGTSCDDDGTRFEEANPGDQAFNKEGRAVLETEFQIEHNPECRSPLINSMDEGRQNQSACRVSFCPVLVWIGRQPKDGCSPVSRGRTPASRRIRARPSRRPVTNVVGHLGWSAYQKSASCTLDCRPWCGCRKLE